MVGIIGVYKFPMYINSVLQLQRLCDHVIVRLDPKSEIELNMGMEVFKGEAEWDKWKWRQELIEKVPETDLVVNLDEDELFGEGIEAEIERFKKSDKLVMMFNYEMETDGHTAKLYPTLPHCKVFKWKKGLSYHPYAGLCLPTEYANTRADMKGKEFLSRVKIKHFCSYTKEMEKNKVYV